MLELPQDIRKKRKRFTTFKKRSRRYRGKVHYFGNHQYKIQTRNFRAGPLDPPPIEARTKTKGTIYKIRIPTKQVTTPTAISLPEQQQGSRTEPASSVKQQQTEIVPQSQAKIWTPLTTRTIDKHFNTSVTQELLMDDLLLSESDTSISSPDTVCLDEPKEQIRTFYLPMYTMLLKTFKITSEQFIIEKAN